jgi:hypothetical protein
VADRSGFAPGDHLEVDLDGGVVHNRTRQTSIPFTMKAGDRQTFLAGGMTARVRAHLEELLGAGKTR